MSEPWNNDRKKKANVSDTHAKVIIMVALVWSGAMLAAGECIKSAKSCVKRLKTRYNRNVGQED